MFVTALGNVVRGVLMGAADIVPGVSGGTVALVLGIYQRLVASVRRGSLALGRLARLDVRGFVDELKAVEWLLLVPLGIGILTAVVSLAHTIEQLLETEPVRMAGLFFGLVLGSVIVATRLVEHWDARRAVVAVAMGVATFVLLGFRQGPVEDPSLPIYLVAGAIAICAMILPGISGSFLLLMMGMYDNVLGAVTDRDVVVLGVFVLGCVVGLALFSQVLHWGLVNHESTMLAGLIGLMIGSLRVLWPWPSGTGGTDLALPADDVAVPIGLAVVGIALVLGITAVAERLEGRSDADLTDDLTAP